jgi:hypothetical protein
MGKIKWAGDYMFPGAKEEGARDTARSVLFKKK